MNFDFWQADHAMTRQPLQRASSLRSLLIGLAGFVPFFSTGCEGPQNQYVPPPPPDVTVTVPLQVPVTDYIEVNGESEASERAVVRARVRGFIEAIEFEPGEAVERDRVLYKIGDEEYVAAVNSAKAELSAAGAQIAVAESDVLVAQAELNRAEREWERQRTLMEQRATSQTEYDQALSAKETADARLAAAKSAVELAQAARQRAQAGLDRAELDLGYTTVVAPIAGRISTTDVKLGNLVENGTDLTEVVDASRVFVNFTISDRQVLELRGVREDLSKDPLQRDEWRDVPVFARRETDIGFPFSGTLDYVGQTGIDVTTGTLPLRAIFENRDRSLVPGLFVRVRLPVATRPAALLIPARAIVRDRGTTNLLLVDADNRVARREVRLGRQDSGWVIVEEGLAAGERFVVEGLQRSRPGGLVNPTERLADSSELPPEFQPPAAESSATDPVEAQS